MDLGQSIQNLRKHKGLTQKDLSKLTGLKQQHISKIEKGQISPTLDTFLKILCALDIRIDEVLKYEQNK